MENVSDEAGQPPISFSPCYVPPGCQLYNEDCLKTMRGIETGSVDLILQDPPYNTTACDWEYDIDLPNLWIEWERILKADGVIVIFADEPFTSRLIISRLQLFKYRVTWDKMSGSNFLNALIMPLKQTEDAVVFAKVKNGHYTYNPILKDRLKPDNRQRRGEKPTRKSTYGSHNRKNSNTYDNTKKHPTNLISLNAKQEECNSANRSHPTQKPFELMRRFVLTYTNENDLVFDGYSGSGTTAAACIKEKRRFIGSELSREYFDKSVQRLELLRSKPELF